MSKKRKPPKSLTQTDDIADAVSAGSCQLVLDTSPPDYVVKISRYLESSVRQSGPDENPPGTDSDSADSLFITQKPVPEAVRSGKRRHSSFRSDLTSPTELEDDEDNLILVSQREAKTKKKRRRRRRTVFNLPEYHFSFLKEKMWKPDVRQNTGLHNSVTAGFFECVREVGKSYQRGQDLQASLPTLDVDGGYISPISQHEETSEDEDIRVVERKQFVFSSKPKSSQPWYAQGNTVSQVKQHGKIKEPWDKTRHETSHKTPDMTSTLSAPPPVEAESNQHVTTDISVGQRETPNTKTGRKKLLFPQKEEEDELCKDSDATLSDLSPEKCIPKRGETSPTVTLPRGDVFHTDELSQTEQGECEPDSQSVLQTDTNNDMLCSETGLQRRREKKKHRGDHQSTEEPAAQHATPSENVEFREVEETQVSQAIDEDDKSHGKDWTKESSRDDNMLRQMDISETKQKKKKKREQSETEEVQQETEAEGRVEEDSVSNTEDEGKKKKKKKKRKRREEEDVEADESLKEDVEIEETKGPNMNSDHVSAEQFEAPQEAESSYVKRKKPTKKQQSVSNNDTQAEQDCTDANVCNDDVTLAETLSVTKKKKKKVAEQLDVSHTEESTTEALTEPDAEPVTKKKKKKKKSNVDDVDAVAQSDDSVSVWKKEKKRTSSFLLADAEQTASPKHEDKLPASPSPSETTHVWHAEKPAVSNGPFTTELAETPASLEESEAGVRKKKKKKKEKNNEKPNEAPERDLTDIQVEIKKKDESVTKTSDAGCQIDDDVVSKKKKKKKRKDTQEVPPAATEETLVTCSSVVHDSSTCSEQVDTQMFEHTLETPGNTTLNDAREKKKKKKKNQMEDTFTDEMAAKERDTKLEVDSLLSETPLVKSSAHSFVKTNKHTKRLHNPKEDFLDAEAT